ncbi:MAG TPA: hypothetical protein VFJ53_02535, partial [Solirubrobacterales bacterium]|nr:hypothetical protein [Solirubrobacterales bacterium]
MKTWRVILIAAAATLALAALPATSPANDLFTLDANPASDGHVIIDGAGNAYVAWVSEGVGTGVDPVKFCKIPPGGTCSPITLSVPGGTDSLDSAAAAFPVFGPPGTVYVVAPRYVRDDVIYWTSFDAGASFDGGTENDHYSNKTDPTDVFLQGSQFLVGAYNPGLGFSTVDGLGGGEFEFTDPGGSVLSSSMGLDGANPVIAYATFSDPYSLFFYRYSGPGSLTTASSWTGPTFIANGYAPSLA